MRRNFLCAAALLASTGCAFNPPLSQSDQAELNACTSQADNTYSAQNYDALSRTSQTGLYYSATPNHVFDAQNQGAEHVRDDQIQDCLRNGSAANAVPAAPLVTPHIVN